jgi:hypothetical protein
MDTNYMKKAALCLFMLLLLLTACNSKQEPMPKNGINYLEAPVGTTSNGSFIISNLQNIKKEWEARLSTSEKQVTLKDFKIVSGTTAGDEHQQYYMLLANSEDGKVSTASILTLKVGRFYFEKQPSSGEDAIYLNIICEGTCTDGCAPVVSILSGSKYLNCSPCGNCTKKDMEMQ